MHSNLVSFEDIIEGIKDDTGIENLRNIYPRIKRLIYRVEKDIGFGQSAILKKIKYSTSDGSIIVSGGSRRITLPDDLLFLESVGMCSIGFCPGSYRIQGKFLFLCENQDDFQIVYYTLLCDGYGNPAISENHYEAVVSGVSMWLYKPRRFQDKGNANTFKAMEDYYHERIAEARGDDVMPSTAEEWALSGAILKMSTSEILRYSESERCFCCVPLSENPFSQNPTSDYIYHWQFTELNDNIDFAPSVNDAFLEDKAFKTKEEFVTGVTIAYSSIGRIAFAIKDTLENEYNIKDLFNIDVTNTVFDSYYNVSEKTQIFISKEYYSYGNLIFTITKN
jgi:hypothetical protein